MVHPPIRSLLVIGSLGLLAVQAPARPVPPQASGSNYVFALPVDGPRLEVEPASGARLASLRLGPAELLITDRSSLAWGSTFWTSPQGDWGWPPSAALDANPYTGGPQGHLLVLASSKDDSTQIAFVKRISAEDSDTSFHLALTVKNLSASPKRIAPWQVTRVPRGGLTFFSKGLGSGRGALVSQVKESGGWLWFDHAAAYLPEGVPKYFADGSGWMAHVDAQGLLLLEVFPDITPEEAAPGEAEIELYFDGNDLVEIEHQGTYASIKAGDSATWITRWYLRRLPAGVEGKIGDPKLIALVADMVKRASSPAVTALRIPDATTARKRARPGFYFLGSKSPPVDAKGRVFLGIPQYRAR